MWWEEDGASYSGTVRDYSEALETHLVCYDDEPVEKGVKICIKCYLKEVRTRVVCPVRPRH